MPTTVGPNTFGEENLVFSYDLKDIRNSYKGEPTTNFAYLHNGRTDSSYESYMPESGTGQIAALHPGAIRVYNQNGSDISYYLNTGINISNSGVNWYDTNHAYWVYDEILKKPVVQMIDINGVWQAKYMGLGVNWTDIGITNGDQYTISWLQWNSDGVKRPSAGMYWYDSTAGYSDFWDGLSDTGTSTPKTWTRVSQTFTVSAGKSLNQGLTLYMYGMNYSRATLRIADVQLEKKSHPTPFSFAYSRSATQGLLDLRGTSTIDLSNVSFDSKAQMTFDGTNDYVDVGDLGTIGAAYSIECVFKSTSVTSYKNVFDMNYATYSGVTGNTGPRLEQTSGQGIGFIWSGVTNNNGLYNYTNTFAISADTYYHVVFVQNGTTGAMYVNGTLRDQANNSQGYLQTFGDVNIGRGFQLDSSRYFSGNVDMFKIYNRALTSSEVASNYKAIKSRFNI